MRIFKLFILLTIACAIILQSSPSVLAQAFPAGPADDDTVSLGIYRIFVLEKFRPWLSGLPTCPPALDGNLCYGGQYSEFRLTSPQMGGPSTIIGRSDVMADGSTGPESDEGGIEVGVEYPTWVKDGDFVEKPPNYTEHPGFLEVHTAVAAMEMGVYSHPGPYVPWLWAGHSINGQDGVKLPVCPGEVRSLDGIIGLPGESFFNVYMEALIPGLGGLGHDAYVKNANPLLIVNDNLASLPPTVIYKHENSTAVLVRFSNSYTDPNDADITWAVGEPFGYLVLAGHGFSYTNKSASTGAFLTEMQAYLDTHGEMPVPDLGVIPTLTEWGMIIFSVLLFGWMAWVIVRRRKRVTVGI